MLQFSTRRKIQLFKRVVGVLLSTLAIPLYMYCDWVYPAESSPLTVLHLDAYASARDIVKAHRDITAQLTTDMNMPDCDEICKAQRQEDINQAYLAKDCLLGKIECTKPQLKTNQTTALLWVLLALWVGYCFYPLPHIKIVEMLEFSQIEVGDVFVLGEHKVTVAESNDLVDESGKLHPGFREWAESLGITNEDEWGYKTVSQRTQQSVADISTTIYQFKSDEGREAYLGRMHKRKAAEKEKKSK